MLANNKIIKLWGRTSSDNCTKIFWCLAEIGLDYEWIDTLLPLSQKKQKELGTKNPNCLVPILEDDKYILWESNAIVRYLCAKYGQTDLYPKKLEKLSEAEKWMDWQMSTIEKPLSVILWNKYRYKHELRDELAIAKAIKDVTVAFKILDEHLADRIYMLREKFTMADIPLGVMVYRWFAMDFQKPIFPNLKRWYELLSKRVEYKKHVKLPLA